MSSNPYTNYLKPTIRLGLAVCMCLVAILFGAIPFIRDFEYALYDQRARMIARRSAASPDIVLVGIDDDSLERMEPAVKRWPWPRFVHGLVVDYCSAATVIGVDILFPEQQWSLWPTDPGDPAFIDAVADSDRVLLAAVFTDDDSSDVAIRPRKLKTALEQAGTSAAVLEFAGVMPPFVELLGASRGAAHVNMVRDEDGVLRRSHPLILYGEHLIPSLPLAVTRSFLGLGAKDVRLDDDLVLHMGDREMPLAEDGGFLINQGGAPFDFVSAVDVIESWNAENEGRQPIVSRDYFKDKIVMYGINATGVRDHEITPLAESMPGLEVNAQVVQNLMEGRSNHVPLPWVGYLLMICTALLPSIPRFDRPRALALAVLGLFAAYVAVALALAWAGRLMVPMVGPINALVLSGAALQTMYWGQERGRRRYFEALDRAKQQFTDMLVHDLKNTVAPIIMTLTMVDDEPDLDAELSTEELLFWRKDFPEIVSTSAGKLMTQINALLDIRRMQEGRMPLELKPVPGGAILDRIDAEFRVPTQRSDLGLKLIDELPATTGLLVDVEVFDRVLGNLIWNAIKYADLNSEIEVGMKVAASGRITCFVANQGRPIPQDIQPDLFNAFITGEDANEGAAIPSTGLGLTFCRLAIEAHEGDIQLISPRIGRNDGVEVAVEVMAADLKSTDDGH